ncbi:DNA recombination protein RmuC [Candidatus Omnitrophota bacterium]
MNAAVWISILTALGLFILSFLAFYIIIRIRDILKNLDFINKKFPDTEDARRQASDAIASINKEMGSLNQKAQEISSVKTEVVSLRNLFTGSKKAGLAGEQVLEKMLSDVLGKNMYESQKKLGSGNVDFVIKFKECLVPIDSKLSLENFRRFLEADEHNAQRSLWKTFSADVKRRIDETGKYIMPGEGTTDFAFMYVPSESVYYEAFVKDKHFGEENNLPEYARRKRVCPISPQTIYPYLVIILQGMKALKIEESAKDVINKISGIKNELRRFSEAYNIIIGHIQDAQKKHSAEGAPRLDSLRKNLENLGL